MVVIHREYGAVGCRRAGWGKGAIITDCRGGSRIFIYIGGAKIMCPHAHYEHGTELTFGRGPGPA